MSTPTQPNPPATTTSPTSLGRLGTLTPELRHQIYTHCAPAFQTLTSMNPVLRADVLAVQRRLTSRLQLLLPQDHGHLSLHLTRRSSVYPVSHCPVRRIGEGNSRWARFSIHMEPELSARQELVLRFDFLELECACRRELDSAQLQLWRTLRQFEGLVARRDAMWGDRAFPERRVLVRLATAREYRFASEEKTWKLRMLDLVCETVMALADKNGCAVDFEMDAFVYRLFARRMSGSEDVLETTEDGSHHISWKAEDTFEGRLCALIDVRRVRDAMPGL